MRLRRLLRGASLAALFSVAACANPVQTATKTATQTAVDTLTSPHDTQQIDQTVQSAVQKARDTALDATTQHRVQVIVSGAVDSATAPEKLDAIRERLVGAPLRADVDELLTAEGPKVQALLAPVDAESAKWREFGIGAVIAICAMQLLHLALLLRRRT